MVEYNSIGAQTIEFLDNIHQRLTIKVDKWKRLSLSDQDGPILLKEHEGIGSIIYKWKSQRPMENGERETTKIGGIDSKIDKG